MAELVLDDALFEGMAALVDRTYVEQARQVAASRSARVRQLVTSRRMPENGWGEEEILALLGVLASMDSNNFEANVGVGEREARVASPLVRRLHLGMAHGVGRSGDVAAVQPKAAGSSLLSKLSNALALDALREAGFVEMRAAVVVPCATGLSLAMSLLALAQKYPGRRAVVWLRIDQKSCLKGIALAGFRILVVEPSVDGSAPRKPHAPDWRRGDELLTNASALEAAVREAGDDLLCVVSTTSCFAPRAPDDVEAVARLCARAGVGHVVNNAYGVQCAATCANISRAQRVGRIDLVVQSTDKNFLVPVGGAIVASNDPDLVSTVAKAYPGRASATPARDLLITLLGLGKHGWRKLLADRETLLPTFRLKLADVARKHGERLLDTPHNRISCAISLDTLPSHTATKFGSMLFTRCCSGTRVVDSSAPPKKVAGIDLTTFGANASHYPRPYLTAACALGLRTDELDHFLARLDKTFAKVRRLQAKQDSNVAAVAQPTPPGLDDHPPAEDDAT